MSELNKIVTNFPMSLTDEENRNLALTLSAVVDGGGGGGVANAIWKPAVDQDGLMTWSWDTFPDSARPPESVNIKGPRGESGAPGRDGTNGTNGTNGKDGKDAPIPEFQIDSSTAHWQWKYTSASSWTDIGITASGSVGPRGEQGQTGPVGPTGASGTKGDDGFSPTVTTSEIGPTSEHPQGGTSVTITDKNGPNQFNVWNGINGQGATVNLLEGPGIQIRENGTSYTIGVSADYALRSELPDLTPYATSAWVKEQGYLTQPDLADYATETYVANASAETLSEADGRYMRKETDSTLDGVGTSADKLRISDTVMDQIEAKSHVYMTSAGNVSVENTSGTVDANFVQYGQVGNRPIPRMLLCATADTYTEIVENVLPAASGMGAVIFVIESH